MFNAGTPHFHCARWTIGAIALALMLLAACDPRRASIEPSFESLAASFIAVT